MKWVQLSCHHFCWIPWIEAFPGREVMCPGPGEQGQAGYFCCARVPQTVVRVVPRLEVVA